jgi:hypothetical protein
MSYDEPPLGFECGWCPDLGRVCLSQDHIGSRFREESKEPKLWLQPDELPDLIEQLKRVIWDDVMPHLDIESRENQLLIDLLYEYRPHEPHAKKKGPPAAG